MARIRFFRNLKIYSLAPGEVQARVRDVDLARQHRHPHRVDPVRLLTEQPLQDLDVVDHHVPHDVDVGRPLGERPHPVHLGEQGPFDALADDLHPRVEPLQVTDLQDATHLARQRDETLGLIERRGDGAAARYHLLPVPGRKVTRNRRTVGSQIELSHGDVIGLGPALSVTFLRPVSGSATALLEFAGDFNVKGCRRALLFAESGRDGAIVVGPGPHAHVPMASDRERVEILRGTTGDSRGVLLAIAKAWLLLSTVMA